MTGVTSRIWRDGNMVEWKQATIHVMSHVVHLALVHESALDTYGWLTPVEGQQ